LQEIFLNRRSGLGMQQSFDCGFIALRDGCLQFVAWSAKACPSELVGHKLQISERHIFSLHYITQSSLSSLGTLSSGKP